MSLPSHRTAGVLLPLFAIRDEGAWGIGALPELGAIAPWLKQAGFSVLMLLPLLEAALGQDSPYSAQSAFALDPVYLDIEALEDFEELGGVGALGPDDRACLERVRAAPRVDWAAVRTLKEKWLRRCFARFVASGAALDSARERDLAAFREAQADWLSDYVLFRALKEADRSSWWQRWDEPLRLRDPEALAAARARTAVDCAFFEYLQWQAQRQLAAARAEARRHGVLLAGDLPFMVAEDSADAWARQEELRFDAKVGAPPDAYSEDGQDWGLPVYRWDLIARAGYPWLRRRGVRTAEAFDLFRVDHAVGFYRTYVRPKDKSPASFSPATEKEELEQGEAIMRALASGGAGLLAEDLGTVPAFVRASLTLLGIPGFRVLRWEKEGEVFRDPALWPALSVAATGTHDTEPAAVWWEQLADDERSALLRLRTFEGLSETATRFGSDVHRAILEAVYGSGSDLLILPVQDLFGERARINLPGTVSADNWSYRMPYSIADLSFEPRLRERTLELAALARHHRRHG